MNFIRLHDPLPTVLFEDDDIVAIDKPYGFNAHTNDSKIEHSEFIQDGLIEICEKMLGRKLHIVHRLDQTTTGVMIFGKSVDSTKKYADFFFNREVKKTYWFLTRSKSDQDAFLIEQSIFHKDRELDAKTQMTILKKVGAFELWQANPYTGRNHQIRIHAKAAQIPILGDVKYGGFPFGFLCLHNHKIEFPNGIRITSKPPAYFEDPTLLEDGILTRALFESDRRQRLFSFTKAADQSFRLVHFVNNSTDPSFTIDQFGPCLVMNWNREQWNDSDVKKFTYFSTLMKKPLLVRFPADKEKPGAGRAPVTLSPAGIPAFLDAAWIAHEGPVQYEMRIDGGASSGLVLSQRLQRQWIRNQAENKTVLNLFAGTCTGSVNAAIGKAQQVTSVEASKNALNWGRRNFALNGLDDQNFKFFCRDSFTYIEQCLTKNEKFDLIICDTPSFMKREKKVFKIKTDLEPWLKNCLSCLNPGGILLFSTSFDDFFIQDIRKIVLQAQKSAQIKNLEISCILPSLDFELPSEKANLKSFIITRLP